MKIRILIEGLSKRPGTLRLNAAAYVISCALQNGKEVTKNGFAEIPDATTNRVVLSALLKALKSFTKQSEIRIIIGDDFVRNTLINGWPAKWKAAGWQRPRGEIKNADLWKQIQEELEKHYVSYGLGIELDHEYKNWMHEELERRTKQCQKTI